MRLLLQVFCCLAARFRMVYSACPSNGISSSEACYWTVPQGTESEVINYCEADGGVLASIPEMSVVTFLQTNYLSVLDVAPDNFFGYYIGVNDKVQEGQYWNYEGQPQSWTFWDTGEPNDDGSPTQDCVRLVPVSSFRWKDCSCDESAAGLCYFKYTTSSQTTSLANTSTLETTMSQTTSLAYTSTLDTTTSLANTSTLLTTVGGTKATFDKTSGTTKFDSDVTTTTAGTTTELLTPSLLDVMTLQSLSSPGLNKTEECFCVCYSTHSNIDTTHLQDKIDKLVLELTIPKKDTSQNRRKLTSASDNRTSARSIGYVGAIVLILVGGFIIGIDALNLCTSRKG